MNELGDIDHWHQCLEHRYVKMRKFHLSTNRMQSIVIAEGTSRYAVHSFEVHRG